MGWNITLCLSCGSHLLPLDHGPWVCKPLRLGLVLGGQPPDRQPREKATAEMTAVLLHDIGLWASPSQAPLELARARPRLTAPALFVTSKIPVILSRVLVRSTCRGRLQCGHCFRQNALEEPSAFVAMFMNTGKIFGGRSCTGREYTLKET